MDLGQCYSHWKSNIQRRDSWSPLLFHMMRIGQLLWRGKYCCTCPGETYKWYIRPEILKIDRLEKKAGEGGGGVLLTIVANCHSQNSVGLHHCGVELGQWPGITLPVHLGIIAISTNTVAMATYDENSKLKLSTYTSVEANSSGKFYPDLRMIIVGHSGS